ncbi:MAG TPA: hypothetical protein PKN24_13635 [bacterium]|nr:hypothetical protein [bacterium]
MQEGSRKGSIVALAVFLLGGGLVLCHEHRCSLARQQHSLCVAAAWRLDWPAAQRGIDQACELWPANALYWAESALARERQLPLLRFDSPRQLVDAPARRQASAARHRLQHALALNPADALFWHNSAWLCWRLGDVDGALQAVHRSRQLDPHTAVYAFSCGYFLELQGQIDSAVVVYADAVRLAPAALRSRFYSDFCQRHPQQVVRLQQIARDSLQAAQHRSPIAAARLAAFYFSTGRHECARPLLKQVTAELENLDRPWTFLGCLLQSEAPDSAERLLRRAAFLAPADPLPLLQLADLYADAGKQEQAIAAWRSSLAAHLTAASAHSRIVPHLYPESVRESAVLADDVIPAGWSAYCDPEFDWSAVCERLAYHLRMSGRQRSAARIAELQPDDRQACAEILHIRF